MPRTGRRTPRRPATPSWETAVERRDPDAGSPLIQSGQALSYLVSSVLSGLAWTIWGPESASRIAAALVAVAALAVGMLLRGIPASEEEQA